MPLSDSLLHQLLDHQRRQPFDLRLEALLAELLAHGYHFDDFLIRPVGLFARRYRRDIGSVSEEPFERQHHEVIRTVLEVHREGLYDALPQQLFHRPGSGPNERPATLREMVEDSQRQRRTEKSTRKFFLPFEQEFFRWRVRFEQEERRYFTSLSAHWYNEALARFWGLHTAQLPPTALTNLLYLLPLATTIVGDLPRTESSFESVLGQPVRLRVIDPLRHPLPAQGAGPARAGTLGHAALGYDLVLGGDYHETLPALELTLHQLSVTDLEAYLTDDWPARALALLCKYFIAFETDVVLRYELATTEPAFMLGEGVDAPILGYTTAGI